MSLLCFTLFAYGTGPPTFAGSISYNKLPAGINIVLFALSAVATALVPYWFLRRSVYYWSKDILLLFTCIYFIAACFAASQFLLIAYLMVW